MSLSLEDELKFNRPQAVVKASDLLKNKNKNTLKGRATVKKSLNKNSLKAAKSHNKNTANAKLNKSQASLRSKLLAEITNRVSKLSKKFKVRAQLEKNAVRRKLAKKSQKKAKATPAEENNPALRADKCMTFQKLFFDQDTKGKKTVKKNADHDVPTDKDAPLPEGGDGELNEDEQKEFLAALKADSLFGPEQDVSFDDCVKATEGEGEKKEVKGEERFKEDDNKNILDKNNLIDIDEALKCFKLDGPNCRTDTNQLGQLYSRRITSAVSQINDEVENLKTKRGIIEDHLEHVNDQLRKLQDELDEDTAIYKTKETMNSVQLAMVNMRLNLNLNIKHEINNWLPNEEMPAGDGPVENGGAGGNNAEDNSGPEDDKKAGGNPPNPPGRQ